MADQLAQPVEHAARLTLTLTGILGQQGQAVSDQHPLSSGPRTGIACGRPPIQNEGTRRSVAPPCRIGLAQGEPGITTIGCINRRIYPPRLCYLGQHARRSRRSPETAGV
jgi:hypothetical protein